MSWLSAIESIFYFLLFYLAIGFYLFVHVLNTIFSFVLVIIAPFTHLVTYVAHGLFIPIRFLSYFEVCHTLSSYLSVSPFAASLVMSIRQANLAV